MRKAAAIFVVGLSIAAAVPVGLHRVTHSATNCRTGSFSDPFCSWTTRPVWVIPVAILIGFTGFAIAAAILSQRKKAAPADGEVDESG